MITQYIPIGIVNTPFKDLNSIPIQPSKAKEIESTIDIRIFGDITPFIVDNK